MIEQLTEMPGCYNVPLLFRLQKSDPAQLFEKLEIQARYVNSRTVFVNCSYIHVSRAKVLCQAVAEKKI